MNHIDEFTIHQFRGTQNLKLEGLGQVNLLIGDNNSGKTSILEALYLFCNPLSRDRWSAIASMRERREGTRLFPALSLNEQLTWLFPQGKEYIDHEAQIARPTISLSALGPFPLKSVSAYYENSVEIERVQRLSHSIEGEDTIEEIERERERINIYVNSGLGRRDEVFTFPYPTGNLPLGTGPKNAILPSHMIDPSLHRFSSTSSRLWSETVNAETKSDAISLIRLFDPDIEDIDIVVGQADRPVVSVKHKKLKRAPLSTFGDGLRRIFTLAAAIPGVRGGLLLVDELELAIHTGAIEKTFSWLIKACIHNEVQLFATTHSLETVDAVLNAIGEDIDLVTYRLRKNGDGVTVTRFDKQLLSQLRNELGLEVR